jgi:hypothetical protein
MGPKKNLPLKNSKGSRSSHLNPALLKALEPHGVINLNEWDLVGAEVRPSTGKFVSSTWEKAIDGKRWRIVIVTDDRVESIQLVTTGSILRPSDWFGAPFENFVADVNRSLMAKATGLAPQVVRKPKEKPKGLSNKPMLPGIDYPAPAGSLPKRPVKPGKSKKARKATIARPAQQPSISIEALRDLAQGKKSRFTTAGRCRFCGGVAVRGSDTCYSCG